MANIIIGMTYVFLVILAKVIKRKALASTIFLNCE